MTAKDRITSYFSELLNKARESKLTYVVEHVPILGDYLFHNEYDIISNKSKIIGGTLFSTISLANIALSESPLQALVWNEFFSFTTKNPLTYYYRKKRKRRLERNSEINT